MVYKIVKTKKCRECGKDFSPSKTTQVFCGHKCSNIAGNKKRSLEKQKTIICLWCKESFVKRPSDVKIYNGSLAKNKYRYCSRKCLNNGTQTISSLKKKVWGVFTLYIKERDHWTCFTCGKHEEGPTMHGGHFISRRHNATLFDERNVHAQCAGCNMFRNGELHIYAQKLLHLYGQEWLDKLIEDSKQEKKFTREELRGLCVKYQELIEKQRTYR